MHSFLHRRVKITVMCVLRSARETAWNFNEDSPDCELSKISLRSCCWKRKATGSVTDEPYLRRETLAGEDLSVIIVHCGSFL